MFLAQHNGGLYQLQDQVQRRIILFFYVLLLLNYFETIAIIIEPLYYLSYCIYCSCQTDFVLDLTRSLLEEILEIARSLCQEHY